MALSSSQHHPALSQVSHEIARSQMNTFLTPSSIAAELRPDLDPEQACEIYTGVAQPSPAVLPASHSLHMNSNLTIMSISFTA